MAIEVPSLIKTRITYLVFVLSWFFFFLLLNEFFFAEDLDVPGSGIFIFGVIPILITALLFYFIKKDLIPPVRFFAKRWISGLVILFAGYAVALYVAKLSGWNGAPVDLDELSASARYLIIGGVLSIVLPVTFMWNRGLYGLMRDFEDQRTCQDYFQIILVNSLPVYLVLYFLHTDLLLKPLSYFMAWQILVVFRHLRLYSCEEANHDICMIGWGRWGLLTLLVPAVCAGLTLSSNFIIVKLIGFTQFLLNNLSTTPLVEDIANIWKWLGVLAAILAGTALLYTLSKRIFTRLNAADCVPSTVTKTTTYLLYGVSVMSCIMVGVAVMFHRGDISENANTWGLWLVPIILYAFMIQYLHFESFWIFLMNLLAIAFMALGFWMLGFVLGLVVVVVVGFLLLSIFLSPSPKGEKPQGTLRHLVNDIFVDSEGREFSYHGPYVDANGEAIIGYEVDADSPEAQNFREI